VGTWSATICESLAQTEPFWPESPQGLTVEQQWQAAIAAMTQLLQQTTPMLDSQTSWPQGIVLAGPTPILSEPSLAAAFESWIFAVGPLQRWVCQLPPAEASLKASRSPVHAVSLLPDDPIVREQFCLVLTAQFGFVAVCGRHSTGEPTFQFSFAPEAVQRVGEMLRLRMLLSQSDAELQKLEAAFKTFAPSVPPYEIVLRFSQILLQGLPQLTDAVASQSTAVTGPRVSLEAVSSHFLSSKRALLHHQTVELQTAHFSGAESRFDIELLQAIAHEVRTPLTTISTLTRLLLKRSDLPAEVIKRLEAIYRECGEQIDRFGLIFRAMELETNQSQGAPVHLAPVSLVQVFQDNIPRWQKLAARRNLTLEVSLPAQLPTVVSDPTMLDSVLTGLIDRFAHGLPMGSQIQLEVSLAGEQLKLQVRSQSAPGPKPLNRKSHTPPSSWQQVAVPVLKSVGQLLMLQPETGNLSLSLPVTKNLFQALGGKLTVRNLPRQGEILTIFLPLGCD
jgi:signal transduction histidine kinase